MPVPVPLAVSASLTQRRLQADGFRHDGPHRLHTFPEAADIYRPASRGVTLLGSAQLVETVKNTLGISLAAGILLAVVSCTAPEGTAPITAAPTVTASALASTAPDAPAPAPNVTASDPPAPANTASQAAPGLEAPPLPAPQTPALETFTFPDGHISFSYPAGWSVREPQEGPYLDAMHRAAAITSTEVVVSDESGAEVARVMNGQYGDNAAGPVRRTVLDHAPVTGIPPDAGEPVEFGFALDEFLDVDAYYFMDVRLAHEFLPAQEDSGTNQVSVPNGEMAAYVVFDAQKQPVFATTELAKAWMASEQYIQLKALLLSLKYT